MKVGNAHCRLSCKETDSTTRFLASIVCRNPESQISNPTRADGPHQPWQNDPHLSLGSSNTLVAQASGFVFSTEDQPGLASSADLEQRRAHITGCFKTDLGVIGGGVKGIPFPVPARLSRSCQVLVRPPASCADAEARCCLVKQLSGLRACLSRATSFRGNATQVYTKTKTGGGYLSAVPWQSSPMKRRATRSTSLRLASPSSHSPKHNINPRMPA